MLNNVEIIINNHSYECVFEAEKLIRASRYNKNQKMWIVINVFNSDSDAESELLKRLTNEYIRQKQQWVVSRNQLNEKIG